MLASRRLVGLACTLHFQSGFSVLTSGPIPTKSLAPDWIGARRPSAPRQGQAFLGALPLCVGMARRSERRSAHRHHTTPPPNEAPSWELCKYFCPLPRLHHWAPFRLLTFLINGRGVRREAEGEVVGFGGRGRGGCESCRRLLLETLGINT